MTKISLVFVLGLAPVVLSLGVFNLIAGDIRTGIMGLLSGSLCIIAIAFNMQFGKRT